MRRRFRRFLRSGFRRSSAKCFAPIGVALAVLLLVAQNPQVLASVLNNPVSLFARDGSDSDSDPGLRDPLDVMADRSPGGRDPNAIYSIKSERIAALFDQPGTAPHERVLSIVRERPAPLVPPPPAGDPIASLFPDSPLAFNAPQWSDFAMPGFSPGEVPGSGFTGGSPGGGPAVLVPPGGSGPPPPPSAPPGPDVPPDVPSAVPEPSTWLMLIVGFFAVAGALRHRRPRALAVV